MAPGQCDWLTGQSIMMDGGNALATGGNFYELREWSDAQWAEARERIEAQNQKDPPASPASSAWLQPDSDQDRDLTIATARRRPRGRHGREVMVDI